MSASMACTATAPDGLHLEKPWRDVPFRRDLALPDSAFRRRLLPITRAMAYFSSLPFVSSSRLCLVLLLCLELLPAIAIELRPDGYHVFPGDSIQDALQLEIGRA